jgi:hypothetical protein
MVLNAHRSMLMFASFVLASQIAFAQSMNVFSPPHGQYSVYMEGQPEAKSTNTVMGMTTVYGHDEKAGGYSVACTHTPISHTAAADVVNRSLNGACNGAVAGMHGKETSRYTVNLPGGYPGRQIEGSLPDGVGFFRMRMYLVDNNFYQLVVVGSKAYINGKAPATFLNSLSITPKTTATVSAPVHKPASGFAQQQQDLSPEALRKKQEQQYKSIMLHENVKHSLEHAKAGQPWGSH